MKLKSIIESYEGLEDDNTETGFYCETCAVKIDDGTRWCWCEKCNKELCENCGYKAAYEGDPNGSNWGFEFRDPGPGIAKSYCKEHRPVVKEGMYDNLEDDNTETGMVVLVLFNANRQEPPKEDIIEEPFYQAYEALWSYFGSEAEIASEGSMAYIYFEPPEFEEQAELLKRELESMKTHTPFDYKIVSENEL